jgi:hypothetical protein
MKDVPERREEKNRRKEEKIGWSSGEKGVKQKEK